MSTNSAQIRQIQANLHSLALSSNQLRSKYAGDTDVCSRSEADNLMNFIEITPDPFQNPIKHAFTNVRQLAAHLTRKLPPKSEHIIELLYVFNHHNSFQTYLKRLVLCTSETLGHLLM